jgi:hypothetical protein
MCKSQHATGRSGIIILVNRDISFGKKRARPASQGRRAENKGNQKPPGELYFFTSCMLGERGIELRSLKEHIDTTTSTGKLMFHSIGAMTKFERDVISGRTQAGLDAGSARGRRGGRPKATQKIEP